MKKLSFFVTCTIILFTACSNNTGKLNVNNYEHVNLEAYTEPTHDFEIGDYKKVNSLTLLNEKGSSYEIEAFLIEDYFDENDEHIESNLLYSDLETGDKTVTVKEPLTIFLNEDMETDFLFSKTLTSSEQEELKEHLLKVYDEHF